MKPVEQFSKKLGGLQPNCKPCSRELHRAWHAANKERQNQKAKDRYAASREVALEKQGEYYRLNREQRKAYTAEWRKANPGYAEEHYAQNAEKYRQQTARWRAENPDKCRSQWASRRSRAKRFAPWADRDAMAAIYAQAKELRRIGVDCHVDHVIPLKGKTVSGLHVHTNLEIILAVDNLKKGAKA